MITQSLLQSIQALAHDAGDAIMQIYQQDFAVAYKDDQSPLTAADLAAHEVIVKGLEALTPGIPILSEEDVQAFQGPNQEGYYWLIDPLDGTKEFIKKNGEFTVNIALIHQGQSVLGLVYAPAQGLTYSAAKGMGAFKQNSLGKVQIHALAHQPGTPWRIVGSRSHGNDAIQPWLAQFNDHSLISMGSSLKLCLVAENLADLYPRFGLTSLWDTAAAQCVVEEAGAQVLDLQGGRLGYQNSAQILNPHFIVGVDVNDLLVSNRL